MGLTLISLQIDVLEHAGMTNLVLLQTVLDEVKNRNSATYTRIRGVIQDADKHACAFTNEHHRETYIERNQNESANDRNDRGLCKAGTPPHPPSPAGGAGYVFGNV
jgi:exosome complex exonuclease DIS3/RRP44